MTKVRRYLLIVMAAFLSVSTSQAGAQEKRTVFAKEEIVLANSSATIEILAEPTLGRLERKESPPKTFVLSYLAPDIADSIAVTAKFKTAEEGDRSVTITVSPPDQEHLYPEAFKALFILFVIALLLESGLAILFNWRPFVVTFDGRGVKSIISVLVAYILVERFDLDIVTQLVNVYSLNDPPFSRGFFGKFITALVIAGGSIVVNNLMIALGFRSVRTADQITPKPPKTEGWISVSLDRKNAVGPVEVLIGVPATAPPVAGTIVGSRRHSPLARLFLRDPGRFPPSGGFRTRRHRVPGRDPWIRCGRSSHQIQNVGPEQDRSGRDHRPRNDALTPARLNALPALWPTFDQARP